MKISGRMAVTDKLLGPRLIFVVGVGAMVVAHLCAEGGETAEGRTSVVQ